MVVTCENVVLGVIGQPLNRSSTTNLRSWSAVTGRYWTDGPLWGTKLGSTLELEFRQQDSEDSALSLNTFK